MKRRSVLSTIVVAAVMTVAATRPSAAQQVCLQLESQLAALERQNAQAVYQAAYNQYTQARTRYDQTYAQAQQMGCIRFFEFMVPDNCGAILSQLDTQLAQVNAADRELQAANPNQANAARENILRALAANNCGPQYAPYANQPQQGGLLNRLFGVPQPGIQNGPALVPLVTTYRTICVRACDGYYFPLSFSTTPAYFPTDQRTCEAQCPGATLYYYENPGAPVETAVSVNGERYTALENAFAYRDTYNPQCGCQPATQVAADQTFTPIPPETIEVIAEVAAALPLPQRRPEPTEDPETIANRLGDFTPGAFAIGETDLAALLTTEEGNRLIGPAYLYAR